MRSIESTTETETDTTAATEDYPENCIVLRNMLNREIQSAISYRSDINVECVNGVVTLSGNFANEKDKNTALCKAVSNPGVCKVINNAN